MILQIILDKQIGVKRAAIFCVSTLLHYAFINLCQRMPQLQQYHASIIMVTFASFATNNPNLYTKLSEHLSLMLGYTSISYLSSTFVSTSWI